MFHLRCRIEELHCELLEEKILTATLQSEMDGEERLDEAFKEVLSSDALPVNPYA